ncbi:hypothetical protein ANAPC1_01343 [Anaplasma phagocytophilum]|uniref:Uncharacterized protein n=1 Tax=Anaplasma phagocytophilum TaxID=948 RepID=A0AA45ZI19_ANAPH|nr:hypothetical protein [Anaplasma phagocytophilum]SBO14965.1 hypothetical protein ANAPC1_01343 [Anaplasma phagocytophilum]SBO30959.1 hypothetical protein ANAPC2_00467 [Anaplasma phagocytophilum]SBO32453.1 hypothetical protein ANAPC3_00870 [Anaplasma phagocytophilum]SBO32495.1 hypothetical protein ANAPC4_00831 [Anaplasma phagocytophilum]SCV64993.1 hypothetical protein ANAPC5_01019 [Anaplasma phagocytophilum]
MKITNSKINDEVCKLASGHKYGDGTDNTNELTCGMGHSSGDIGDSVNGGLKEFGQYVLKKRDYKDWPTTQGTQDKGANNALKVAEGLTKLAPEYKTIVAGLLAKTIEGGDN